MSDMYSLAAKKASKETLKKGLYQPAMAEKKSPVVAFIVGFMFGFLGYGVMTGDWKAAGWLLLTFLLLLVVIPGLGAFIALIITGGMCAARVQKSNELGGHV